MLRGIIIACLLAGIAPAAASTDDTICDRAALAAATDMKVPAGLLRALTRTETGRSRNGRLTPWPWTVNMEGAGHWFETRGEALAFVLKHHRRGARSFDIGCFQINFRWHGDAFATIEAMFDPLANARYAAQFLTKLRGEASDWSDAVGHFHSKTPSRAAKYRSRFQRILTALAPVETLHAPVAAPQTAAIAPRPASGEALGTLRLAFLTPPRGTLLASAGGSAPSAPQPTGGVALRLHRAAAPLFSRSAQALN